MDLNEYYLNTRPLTALELKELRTMIEERKEEMSPPPNPTPINHNTFAKKKNTTTTATCANCKNFTKKKLQK